MHDVARCETGVAEAPSVSDFDFELPGDLIAQAPPPRRDDARLMVLERAARRLTHHGVGDLPALLRAGDLLVFNDARVRPARLRGRATSGGALELLVVRARAPDIWECLGRPPRRLRPGATLALPAGATAVVVERLANGRYAVRFQTDGGVPGLLARCGEVPLPPYIKRPHGPVPADRERYQTVFARCDGALAAPTAGLHFTTHLLAQLAEAGIASAWITLLVGPATFLPLRGALVDERGLEPEWADLPQATVSAIAHTRRRGGRVIAVGTTTTRALESAAQRPGGLTPGGFWADAFLRPGARFAVVDGLLTNFHLPRSTLLMLVSAFAGRELVLGAYAAAVRARYRFYSYGDAMLIT